MELKQNSLTGPVITGSFKKQAPACELTNAMTLNIFTFHLLKQETNQ